MYQVHCVKCKTSYESPDPDDYYCPVCLEIKKKIEIEVEKKIISRPKKQTKSELQLLDETGSLSFGKSRIFNISREKK